MSKHLVGQSAMRTAIRRAVRHRVADLTVGTCVKGVPPPATRHPRAPREGRGLASSWTHTAAIPLVSPNVVAAVWR